MKHKLILFDFDGTLADTLPWMISIVPAVFQRFGVREVAAEVFEELRSDPAPNLLRKAGVPLWKVPFMMWHVRRLAQAQAPHLTLFEGVPELLSDLHKQGRMVGIVSSNAEAVIAKVLGPELAAKIRFYECSASVMGKKRRLLRLVGQAGVLPSEAIYIGDETRDGVAAQAAGIDFAGVGWGYSRELAFQRLAIGAYYPTLEALRGALIE